MKNENKNILKPQEIHGERKLSAFDTVYGDLIDNNEKVNNEFVKNAIICSGSEKPFNVNSEERRFVIPNALKNYDFSRYNMNDEIIDLINFIAKIESNSHLSYEEKDAVIQYNEADLRDLLCEAAILDDKHLINDINNGLETAIRLIKEKYKRMNRKELDFNSDDKNDRILLINTLSRFADEYNFKLNKNLGNYNMISQAVRGIEYDITFGDGLPF